MLNKIFIGVVFMTLSTVCFAQQNSDTLSQEKFKKSNSRIRMLGPLEKEGVILKTATTNNQTNVTDLKTKGAKVTPYSRPYFPADSPNNVSTEQKKKK